MSDTDLAVLVARMDERYQFIASSLEEAKNQRENQSKKIDDMALKVLDIQSRLDTAEKQLSDTAPTIKEFIAIKHKVQGAGILGKWLWVGGGVVLGWIFSARMEIISWLTKSGS